VGVGRRWPAAWPGVVEEPDVKVAAQVVAAPRLEPAAPTPAERLDAWRASVVALYLNGVAFAMPFILGVWMALRPEAAWAPPARALAAL
jgi:hypothetical protein